jgi:ParB-like chromosome segregation protein Spo0J
MQKIDYVPFAELNIAPFKATYILRPDLLTLSKSLVDFGFMLPIVVQKETNIVIDGNERVSLAKINKYVKKAVGNLCPVIYVECDTLEAQMMHLRLNRSRGNLLAKPTSGIIRNLVKSKKYSKEDLEEFLQMKHDEFYLLLDGSLLKHRKVSEHSYSRAWVPVEADPKATDSSISIERPPNSDR